jgi:hypothetical protein
MEGHADQTLIGIERMGERAAADQCNSR